MRPLRCVAFIQCAGCAPVLRWYVARACWLWVSIAWRSSRALAWILDEMLMGLLCGPKLNLRVEGPLSARPFVPPAPGTQWGRRSVEHNNTFVFYHLSISRAAITPLDIATNACVTHSNWAATKMAGASLSALTLSRTLKYTNTCCENNEVFHRRASIYVHVAIKLQPAILSKDNCLFWLHNIFPICMPFIFIWKI